MRYWMVTMRCRRNVAGGQSSKEITMDQIHKLTMALGQPVTVDHHSYECKTLIEATSAWVAVSEVIIILNRQLLMHKFPEWPAEYLSVYAY